MRLYVIGPVSGHENENKELFEAARRRLEKHGHTVYIPHDFIKPGTSWEVAMRISLSNMLMRAQGVAKLEGDYVSRGTSIEMATAFDCGMPVKLVRDWCK